MDDRLITCCFSGHRPRQLPWGAAEDDERCLALKEELSSRLEGIYQAGYRRFICGMALGCDTFFAEAVLALRDKHPEVCLEAAVPCGSQPERWTEKQRLRYERLLGSCDKVTVLRQDYTPDCMQRRNEYMVDHASLLFACYSGKPGGTMNTLLYAMRQGVKTLIIDID